MASDCTISLWEVQDRLNRWQRLPEPNIAGASPRRSACQVGVLHAGPVRKRVQRTAYNEKGEEVTEMVSEDEEPVGSAVKVDEQVSSPTLDLLHC